MAYVGLDDDPDEPKRRKVPGLEPPDPLTPEMPRVTPEIQPLDLQPPDLGNRDTGQGLLPPLAPGSPHFNPRDALIARETPFLEQQLREAGGDLYDPSDLQGVQRNLSYAQNAGIDPQTLINAQRDIYARRRAPTASAGGTGGDLDLNGDGQFDVPQTSDAARARQAVLPPVPARTFDEDTSAGLESLIRTQLQTLNQPNPQLQRMMDWLDRRFTELSSSNGYSPEELAILRTQASEPIEGYRRASRQRAMEGAAARGFLPSSGITELHAGPGGRLEPLDLEFDRMRVASDRDLAINAINERSRRQNEAMNLGLQFVGLPDTMGRQNRGEQLQLSSLLYDLPRRSMQDALAVLNGTPTSGDLFSQLLNMAQVQQQGTAFNAQRNQQLWTAIGQILAGLGR